MTYGVADPSSLLAQSTPMAGALRAGWPGSLGGRDMKVGLAALEEVGRCEAPARPDPCRASVRAPHQELVAVGGREDVSGRGLFDATALALGQCVRGKGLHGGSVLGRIVVRRGRSTRLSTKSINMDGIIQLTPVQT